MKIGLDASGLALQAAGVGRYVNGLIQGLAQIDAHNHYVVFIKSRTEHLLPSLPANFRTFQLPDFSRPSRLAWQHWLAGRVGDRCGLDVWHGLHYSLPQFHGRMRTVATFHDVAFFLHPKLFSPVKRLYFQQTIRHAWKSADAIISVSHATADDALRWFEGESRSGMERLHIVPSGLDDRFFSVPPQGEIARVRHRYGLSAPYILFLGTLAKRKNVPLLISAFRRLRERGYRELLLVIAGLPSNGEFGVAVAVAQGELAGFVRCLGYVPETDILPLYHGARLFVLPSMHEGFGFPLLEAMACGVPALAADNSAMRELVTDEDMLCVGDAEAWSRQMEEMLLNTNLRERLIARGLKRAREFSWQDAARATLAVYESVARNGGKRKRDTLDSKTGEHHASQRNEKLIGGAPEREEVSVAVLRTLAHADLFDYPLQLKEIHEGLLDCSAELAEVKDALQAWEQRGIVEQYGGAFFLRGRQRNVGMREQRLRNTQAILQENTRLLRVIMNFPGVRSVSLSGAAAFDNCAPVDDIDVFIITTPHRVWSVYVALVIFLKLLGKRKTICLNCLFDEDHLAFDSRDFFVAHQIAFLRLWSGTESFHQFLSANTWIRSHLPQHRETLEPLVKTARRSRLQRLAESILPWRIFDVVERTLFVLYHRRIRRKVARLGHDDVVMNPGQIMMFTNNHRYRVKAALERRLGELLQHISVTHCSTQPDSGKRGHLDRTDGESRQGSEMSALQRVQDPETLIAKER